MWLLTLIWLSGEAMPVPLELAQTEWADVAPIPGLHVSWVVGSETAEGLYMLRVRLEKGSRIPAHHHPDDRLTTVIHGAIYVAFGKHPEEASFVRVAAPDSYRAPAGVVHHVWAKDSLAVYQESGSGPSGTVMDPPKTSDQ